MSDDVEAGFKESSILEKAALTNPLTIAPGALALTARTSANRALRKAGLLDQINLTGSATPEQLRESSVAAGVIAQREQAPQKPGRKQTTLTRSQPRKSILG